MTIRGLAEAHLGVIAPGVLAVGCLALLAAPSPNWMPSASVSRGVLEVFLGAQAAIAALTLAVMIFVLQAVSARSDVDDRKYREYLRRSHIRAAFVASIVAVGFTGAALLLIQPGGLDERTIETPGLDNLLVVGATAFGSNLFLTAYLFNRTLGLTQPGAWRALVRDLNERAVKSAVAAYLSRMQRVAESEEPALRDVLGRDPDEGSADEAIAAILDAALRSVDDRRSRDFDAAIESLQDLIEYAMAEIERNSGTWARPGSSPRWPPAFELHGRLYAFREAVLERGDREHASGLHGLDDWFVSRSIGHGCGELFTMGVDGNLWNYEICVRRGDAELTQFFVDTTWTSLGGAAIGSTWGHDDDDSTARAQRLFPYVERLSHHQERMLAAAMQSNRPDDYARFVQGFDGFLRNLWFVWREDNYPPADSGVLYESIDRIRRVSLAGLGGERFSWRKKGDSRPLNRTSSPLETPIRTRGTWRTTSRSRWKRRTEVRFSGDDGRRRS